MKKTFSALIFCLLAGAVSGQGEFKVKIDDFVWTKYSSDSRVKVLIFFEVKNTGTVKDKCSDLYGISLKSSNAKYVYGRDIVFESISSEAEELIEPGDFVYVSIVYSVPKDADNLTLYFSQETGGDSKLLTESFNKWMQNNRNPDKFVTAGDAEFREKDYIGAIVNYEKALLIKPGLQIHFKLGNAWIMADDYDNAIYCYKKALDEEGSSTETFNNLGYAYFEKGYYDDAFTCFNECYKRDNSHWDAVLGAAISSYELSNLDDAKALFMAAADIENRLYQGMDGLAKLMKTEGYFYTDKQLISINSLCRLLGYTSY